MEKITLHFMATAWVTGFSLEAPTSGHNGEPGFYDTGEYFSREYVLPEGFIVAESEAGPREFYRHGEYFTLGSYNKTPILTDGNEIIYLKRA